MDTHIVTIQTRRPISVCACCDAAIVDEAMTTVVFVNGRIEDYCAACADMTLALRRAS